MARTDTTTSGVIDGYRRALEVTFPESADDDRPEPVNDAIEELNRLHTMAYEAEWLTLPEGRVWLAGIGAAATRLFTATMPQMMREAA